MRQGAHTPPRPSTHRDFESRLDRPGAEFWQVFDFQDHLSAAKRAGLEAALKASGLLDAWRMSVSDYLAALSRGSPLEGPAPESCRNPELASRMNLEGKAIHEEAVLDLLLMDLSRP